MKPKRLPFFKVGKELRERVNAGTGTIEGPDAEDEHDQDDALYNDDKEEAS